MTTPAGATSLYTLTTLSALMVGLEIRPPAPAPELPSVSIEIRETITVTDAVVPPAVIEVAETITVTDVFVPPAVIDVTETVAVSDDAVSDAFAFDFPVNTTDDVADGSCDLLHCSLRDALHAANQAASGATTIGFVLPGPGPHLIRPSTPLPTLTSPLTLDGYTQPGSSPATASTGADIRIVLDGSAIPDAVGLDVQADGAVVRGLEIRGFSQGLAIHGDSSTVQGNHFLANSADGVLVTGDDNVIGGTDPAQRNVLSDNRVGLAIFPGAERNVVIGNLVGFGPSPSSILPNSFDGIAVHGHGNRIGGSAPGEGNRIAGHPSNAVLVGWLGDSHPVPTDNVLQGNQIGVLGGVSPVPTGHGVTLDRAVRSVVGGTRGAANIIRRNAFHGILVSGDATGNRILSNEISLSGGLGINLRSGSDQPGVWVTANDRGDGDTGPNGLQNFPELTTSSTDFTSVQGLLESSAGRTYAVELFVTSVCDERAHGEGETLLESFEVTTGLDGRASFERSIRSPVPASAYFTATATGRGGTSEFARCFPVGLTLPSDDELITSEPLAVSHTGGPGFILQADPDARLTSTTLTVCGISRLRMSPGDRVEVGCGSAVLAVEVGPVEVELGSELVASVPSGAQATVDEADDGGLTVSNDGEAPITLVSGDTELGRLGAGAALALGTLDVGDGRMVVTPAPGRDHLLLEGDFIPGGSSDGFDPSSEEIALTFGPFQQAMPAGSFRSIPAGQGKNGSTKRFHFSSGANGIVLMSIEPDGYFSLVARRIELDALHGEESVPFALALGDDVAAASVIFDAKGNLVDGAAAATASAQAATVARAEPSPAVLAWPDSISVRPGGAATYGLLLTAGGELAGQTVQLGCVQPPAGVTCLFEPAKLGVPAEGAVALFTVQTRGKVGAPLLGLLGSGGGWLIVLLTALGTCLAVRGARPRRSRIAVAASGTVAVLLILIQVACSESPTELPPGPEVTPLGAHVLQLRVEGAGVIHETEVTLVVTDGP